MKTLLFILCFLFVSPAAFARSTLVLIGYLDYDVSLGGKHKVDISIADKLEKLIDDTLIDLGFESRISEDVREYRRGEDHFQILNVNVLCPDTDLYLFSEDAFQRNATSLCGEQIQTSRRALSVLATELKSYDRFIYVGHARKGLGIGVGPVMRNLTFPVLEAHDHALSARSWLGGSLKSIAFVSCESNRYYGEWLRDLGFEFLGSEDDVYLRSRSPQPSAQNVLLQLLLESKKTS